MMKSGKPQALTQCSTRSIGHGRIFDRSLVSSLMRHEPWSASWRQLRTALAHSLREGKTDRCIGAAGGPYPERLRQQRSLLCASRSVEMRVNRVRKCRRFLARHRVLPLEPKDENGKHKHTSERGQL